ncbi:MAG TPA: hypothetical protein VJX69_16220 [Terriglobales bacterium]|nr:hypothetical protein [Terriglobales bacterium]
MLEVRAGASVSGFAGRLGLGARLIGSAIPDITISPVDAGTTPFALIGLPPLEDFFGCGFCPADTVGLIADGLLFAAAPGRLCSARDSS